MENMDIYNRFRICPAEARRPIQAGRLKGKTDINPMWRLKKLTEQFGPSGIGWYITIDRQWLEQSAEETAAFCNISLYVKIDGEWSKPICGTGGSMFVSKERSGLYTDDDALKKAYTDAISVACKALGMAADVYWEKDTDSKYDTGDNAPPPANETPSANTSVICPKCGKPVKRVKGKDGNIISPIEVLHTCGMCADCFKTAKEAAKT